MVPLPTNGVRGMYSHMFKWLSFKGYLQEKGSLAIDPKEMMQPMCDYSEMHLSVMTLF
jgi:hypothetical protein